MSLEPVDIGLPTKFASWRTGQLDAVIGAAASDKRFYLLSMPTGGGKSAVYMGIAKMLDARALVLTSTKGLQAQLINDFRTAGLLDIKGQNNYKCEAETATHVTVDEGMCHGGVECYLKQGGCTYYDAVRKASKAKLVVTNYRYWMTLNAYADPDTLGKFDLLILDEAHDAPDELADFCAVSIDRMELKTLLDRELPPIEEGQEVWADWATSALTECRIRFVAARARIKEGSKYVKLVRRLTDMGQRLAKLSVAGKWKRGEPSTSNAYVPGQVTDWVAEFTKTGVLFSPVWAHGYAEDVLFKGIPKVVLVSATLQPTAARYLGIDPSVYEFKETPSTFDPARRPVYYLPTTKVDRNMNAGQVRIWVNKIDSIIDAWPNSKGIVHTISYDRAQSFISMSRHRGILLTHASRNARDIVAYFKNARAPRVLVSPSMETGWDFPYDQCEYQIIAKVPFLDTRSVVTKARAKADKRYLNYMTALRIIQQCGRGMRAADDRCVTYIVDDNIGWFWQAAREFFPKWFKAGYKQWGYGIPPVPKKVA